MCFVVLLLLFLDRHFPVNVYGRQFLWMLMLAADFLCEHCSAYCKSLMVAAIGLGPCWQKLCRFIAVSVAVLCAVFVYANELSITEASLLP